MSCKNITDKMIKLSSVTLFSFLLYITWNQRLLTNLLRTNKGRIHNAEKVAERTGAVQDQTHAADGSCPPKLKPISSRVSMRGRIAP